MPNNKKQRNRVLREKAIIETLRDRLRESYNDIRNTYGVELSWLLRWSKELDSCATTGIDQQFKLLDKGQEPEPYSDDVLDKIISLESHTSQHIDLYVANSVVGALGSYMQEEEPPEETRKQRIISDFILDEIEQLVEGDFVEKTMIAEQAFVRGSIYDERASVRIYDGNKEKAEIEDLTRKALKEFEKAVKYGKDTEAVHEEIQSACYHLLTFAEMSASEKQEYTQRAIDALNACNRLLPERRAHSFFINSSYLADNYLALNKPEQAEVALLEGINKVFDSEAKVKGYKKLAEIYDGMGFEDKAKEALESAKSFE